MWHASNTPTGSRRHSIHARTRYSVRSPNREGQSRNQVGRVFHFPGRAPAAGSGDLHAKLRDDSRFAVYRIICFSRARGSTCSQLLLRAANIDNQPQELSLKRLLIEIISFSTWRPIVDQTCIMPMVSAVPLTVELATTRWSLAYIRSKHFRATST